jgi:pimeloyl-ACP methyl ester carboxylesterase
LRYLAGTRFSNVENDPAAQHLAEGIYRGLSDFPLERAGYANDIAAWMREDVLSTGQVECPTLLLHDPHDPAAPFCHAEFAATRIANAELIALNSGGHLIWHGPDAAFMQCRRTEFLRTHLAANTSAGQL